MSKLLKPLIIVFLASFQFLHAQSDTLRQITLDEVTVSAFRVETNPQNLPYGISVLSRQDIEAIPNNSVGDLLKKKAFVDIVEYPGFVSSIGMRGFRPTSQGYVLLLVNGIPSGTQNVSTLDLNHAKGVEVLKGPYSSFFGSGAMGGVVNIVNPRSTDQIAGNINFTLGSFSTYGVNGSIGGRISEKLNFDFGVNALTQGTDYKIGSNNLFGLSEIEANIMEVNSPDFVFENTSYDKYNLSGRLGFELNPNWTVDLHQNIFLADNVMDNGSFWGVYGTMEKDVKRWSQSLVLSGRMGAHSIRFSPFFCNEDSRFHDISQQSSFVQSINNHKSYGFVLQDAVNLGDHNLLFGVDNNTNRFENRNYASATQASAPWQPDHITSSTGAFVQVRLNFLQNRLNTTIGGRFDIISFKVLDTPNLVSQVGNETHNVFNPNAGFVFKITSELSFRSNAGTAFLAPDAFRKAGLFEGWSTTVGNPDLKPETSFTFDFGLEYANKANLLLLGLTYFNTNHKDLITTSYIGWTTTTFVNAGNAQMNGLEMKFDVDLGQLAKMPFSLSLSGNWRHLFQFELEDAGTRSNLKYVQENSASLGIGFNDNKRFSSRINARFVGSRLEDNWFYTFDFITWERIPLTSMVGNQIRPTLINEDILEFPSFVVVDFSVAYALTRNISLGLSAQNLFDELYTEKDGYFMPGRNFQLRFGFSF